MKPQQPHHKGIRPKSARPDVDPEIEQLCKTWMRSAARKRFNARFKRRA